jgi:uncharacterized protein YabN with tetrapyrrole methylase and pyrophosphatase domain
MIPCASAGGSNTSAGPTRTSIQPASSSPSATSEASATPRRPGGLTVVGTGIRLVVQVTPEALTAIERADELLYLAAEPVTREWLQNQNTNARSLHHHYGAEIDRGTTYAGMVEEILAGVRLGRNVCAAFYGHPGVFVYPSHEAIRRARAEGYKASMVPGISAADCLFADLGVDPGATGCQTYEATDFLRHSRLVDTSAALILWQVGVIGEVHAVWEVNRAGVQLLTERLCQLYPAGHEVTVYEASPYSVADPSIERIQLDRLPQARMSTLSTLYIPSAAAPRLDPDLAQRLGRLT